VKDGPRFSEAPTEKRTRPTVDLWKEDYTPPERIPVEPPPADDGGARPRLVRNSMASDAEAFQPPRRAGRGSSGDPSEIAPPKTTAGLTPQSRPRPKSGEVATVRGGTANLGSGTHALPQQRGKPIPAETPGPEGPLLEPRRRPPTGAITPPPGATPTLPPVAPPPPPAPAPAEPVASAPPASDVLDAVQAANLAARGRKALDKNEVAQFSSALDDFADSAGGAAPPPAPVAGKPSLVETVADENPAATANAAFGARSRSAPAEPPGGPHMPHYLVTQVLGEPVALSRNQVVRIGRGEDNEVIFPLSQVSRHHAEVRFDAQAGAYVVVDRNSINGTFVNGKAVKRRRLADGDRIAIGPFMIVYRVSTGGTRLRAMDETDVIRPGSLAGEIAEMPIADVARFIEALRKTGELTVIATTGERGTVLFRDGQAVHAEFKVSLGPAAAVAVFRLKTGNFRFSVKPIELARATISQPLGTLLAEAANATG